MSCWPLVRTNDLVNDSAPTRTASPHTPNVRVIGCPVAAVAVTDETERRVNDEGLFVSAVKLTWATVCVPSRTWPLTARTVIVECIAPEGDCVTVAVAG